MPRIPSVSEVRSVSAAVTRDPGVRASAEDFGLGIARGIGNLGEGISGVEPLIQKLVAKIDKSDVAETTIQTERNKAEIRQAAIQMVDDLEYDGSAPLEAAERSAQDLEAMEAEKLKALSPERRAAAREASAPIRQGHGLRAAQRLQNQRVAALERGTAETLKLLQGQAAADPASAEKLTADGLGLLSQMHEVGALNDDQLEQQSTAFRRELYTGMLRGQAAGDVVADLEAGIYDAALGDPELKQLLLIENRWRMQGEDAQGRASGRAMVASAAQGGAAEPKLRAATASLLAAGDFADFELEAEKARRVRSGVESLRFAPEDEFEGEIAKLAPAVETLDQAARLEIQEAVRRGSERLLEERRADPADYAMGLPSVAKAFEAAKADPSLLPSAVSGRLAAQAAMGVSPEDRRSLSKAEVAEILESYRALPAEARGGALKALCDAYGDQCSQVAAELEEAGLPQQVVQALDPSSDGAPIVQASDADRSAASGPQADIIAEIAERLIAEGEERSLPPRPERKPVPSPEDLSALGDDAAAAGSGRMPSIPERKPGSGLHPSEEKLLNKYRPLLEEDEDKAKEGLDQSRIAGLEAIVEFKAQGQGAPSEVADLAKRLALRNLRRGYRFDDAVKSALIETDIEKPNLSLDTSIYVPRATGDPVADSQAIMDRIGYTFHSAPGGEVSELVFERLLDLVNIREIERIEGQQGVARIYSMMQKLAESDRMPVTHHKLMVDLLSLAEEVREVPYKYPWSLTGVELETAMSFLAERGKESADAALLKNAASFLIDFVPFGGPTKKAASGGKRILKAIGISDAISAQHAAEALNAIVNEATYRRRILPDRRLLPGIGLEQK